MHLRKFSFLYVSHSLNSNLALVTFFPNLKPCLPRLKLSELLLHSYKPWGRGDYIMEKSWNSLNSKSANSIHHPLDKKRSSPTFSVTRPYNASKYTQGAFHRWTQWTYLGSNDQEGGDFLTANDYLGWKVWWNYQAWASQVINWQEMPNLKVIITNTSCENPKK